ncbi:MAG: endopeptidase La [Lactobacillales bacterium]|jgi:ATP-dependent Lon protease|nr:endopeptidase La [Lactobacillales bacterium]
MNEIQNKILQKTPPTDGIYPVLALRDIVVFPNIVAPLFVGRDKSIAALENAAANRKQILLVAQTDSLIDTPYSGDLYRIGTIANVLQLLKLPDGTVKILVEGVARAKVLDWTQNSAFFEAHAQIIPEKEETGDEIEALRRSVREQFETYVRLNKRIGPEVLVATANVQDPRRFANIVSTHLALKLADKQQLLETDSLRERLEKLLGAMEKEIGVLQVERKIRKRVKNQMEKSQREYYLNEQIKAIQKELGDNEEMSDIKALEKSIKKAGMPKETTAKAMSELKKLQMMGPMSAEAGVIRNYLDWLVSIPWKQKTALDIDLKKAKQILDEDHYGLDKVKERILEFLAVQKRTNSAQGSILCFIGPPGVGKTSLGQSIARATGRTFVRASLGGMRDEAEIRGHRRTYIGSMPGKIIQGMKKAKTINPLFLLDEIDKLGNDYRGDPSSALLEVLDPEQNKTFNDHYLEVDYDLSNIMFITTANSYRMPRPLLDRMEIIALSGYTENEKIEIAKRHLIKKQLKTAGLDEKELSISDDALLELIRKYTQEAGVRNLEREIANIARKAVKEIQTDNVKSIHVTIENLKKYAGVQKCSYGVAELEDQIGTTTGLGAIEGIGGDTLPIEAAKMPGKGLVSLTGRLGDVMKESVQTAHAFVRSRYSQFGIPAKVFSKTDIHIHAPEGAIPKDGPSAGIAIMTSLVSVLTGIPVHKDIAMTGEITLRGRVLGIGGLKEKLLAALRGGIKTVLIPKENEKDLEEIPENVKKGLKIICVSAAEEVLSHALTKPLTPLSLEESLAEDNVPEKKEKEVA